MSRVAAAEVGGLCELGMDAEVIDHPPGIDLGAVRLRVHERGRPSASGVRALVRELADLEPGRLVVDLIGGRERRLLADAGWSWLEQTGHLTIPQLDIDRRIDSLLSAELSARWRPRWFGLTNLPSRSGLDAEQTAVLRLGRRHLLEPGWASVGADALAAHGLDEVTGDGQQPFYVPDRVALAWALRFWWACEPSQAVALIALPPTPRAVAERCLPAGRPTRGPGPIEQDHDPCAGVDRVVLALHLASQDHHTQAHELLGFR